MIDELHARDVALIRDATIEPSEGLTVLTGETGAGKTALLSAIKLLVGERADSGAVREGADALEVEGRFFVAGAVEDSAGICTRDSTGCGVGCGMVVFGWYAFCWYGFCSVWYDGCGVAYG